MFQQTIQDVLAISACGPRPEDILDGLRSRILAFESFESGELVARSDRGPARFVFAPGLPDLGGPLLDALANEATLRIDTAAEARERGLGMGPVSLLVVRLEVAGYDAAALVLSHSRAWSFAAAPLFRIRTLGNVALRLVAASAGAPRVASEVAVLEAEQARLRSRIETLEEEIIRLRAARTAPPPDKPR